MTERLRFRSYAFDPKTGRATPWPQQVYEVRVSEPTPMPLPAELFIQTLERIMKERSP